MIRLETLLCRLSSQIYAAQGVIVMASNVTYPHIKFHILVSNCLDIEAHCGNRVDALAQLELVEDRGLARRVQPQHQDPHLLVPEHLGEYFPHDEARDQDAVREEDLLHRLKTRSDLERDLFLAELLTTISFTHCLNPHFRKHKMEKPNKRSL